MSKKKCQAVLCVPSPEKIEFLLLKTKPERGSFWQNVTGSVKENEKSKDAALREANEETSLVQDNIQNVVHLFEHSFETSQSQKAREKVYLIVCHNKWEVALDPREHVEYKWVCCHDIDRNSIKYESNYQAIINAMRILV